MLRIFYVLVTAKMKVEESVSLQNYIAMPPYVFDNIDLWLISRYFSQHIVDGNIDNDVL